MVMSPSVPIALSPLQISNEVILLKENVSSLKKERDSLLPLKDKIKSLEKQQGELADMKEKMSSLEKENQSLLQQLESLQSRSSSTGATMDQSSPSRSAAVTSQEERLKWQVEMSNVRRELERKLEAGKRHWEEERLALKQEVGRLREDLSGARESSHQLETLQAQLGKASQR